MIKPDESATSRPAILSIFFALGSVGIALATLLVTPVAIKIVMLVVAALLLASTGAALAIVLAKPQPPVER